MDELAAILVILMMSAAYVYWLVTDRFTFDQPNDGAHIEEVTERGAKGEEGDPGEDGRDGVLQFDQGRFKQSRQQEIQRKEWYVSGFYILTWILFICTVGHNLKYEPLLWFVIGAGVLYGIRLWIPVPSDVGLVGPGGSTDSNGPTGPTGPTGPNLIGAL